MSAMHRPCPACRSLQHLPLCRQPFQQGEMPAAEGCAELTETMHYAAGTMEAAAMMTTAAAMTTTAAAAGTMVMGAS